MRLVPDPTNGLLAQEARGVPAADLAGPHWVVQFEC